jgi:hypothetical protein
MNDYKITGDIGSILEERLISLFLNESSYENESDGRRLFYVKEGK